MRKCCSEGRFSDCSQEAPKEPKETWSCLFAGNRRLPGSRDNCEVRFRLETGRFRTSLDTLIAKNRRLPGRLEKYEVRFRLETGSSGEVWSCLIAKNRRLQGSPEKLGAIYLL